MKEGTGFAKSNPEDNSFFRCASSLQVALPLSHSLTLPTGCHVILFIVQVGFQVSQVGFASYISSKVTYFITVSLAQQNLYFLVRTAHLIMLAQVKLHMHTQAIALS